MKLLLDVNDSKASFILELLSNFNFVKAKTISEGEKDLSNELKQALDEGIKAVEDGLVTDHETVMKETRKRYPNLFK